MDIPSPRRNDPGRYGPAEPKGIADRHDPVADLSCAAVAERHIGQRLVGFDLQQRDIGLGIAPNNFRRVFTVILQRDFDLAGVADDVAVRHHVARGINDESGTERDPVSLAARYLGKKMPLAIGVLLVKKAAQEFVEWRIGKVG